MKRVRIKSTLLVSVLLMASLLCLGFASCENQDAAKEDPAQKPSEGATDETADKTAGDPSEPYKGYLAKLDTKYAYDLAVEITEGDEYQNFELGDRTAGSDAEHATADRLVKEMQDIGLEDVEKIGTAVDKWQTNSATLKVEGLDEPILLHPYATAATPKEGISAPIIYVGKGTAADYEGVDAKGKIVLFEVDQRADWWVTYPMLEAEHQGAVAALACSNKGFSEISDEAYNANDICGPTSIPTASITVKDAEAIKLLDKVRSTNPPKVNGLLKVDTVVEPGGTTYNLLGKIKGKDSEHALLYGAHYDAHFQGFQDDTIAATGVLAMAKSFIESGYTPEHDIWFVLHGAEEWGATNTQYDWCTGAWRLINEAHPEWAGKILTFFNFELPAYEFADYTYTTSDPEQYSMIKSFTENVDIPAPKPDGVFKDGIKTNGYQSYTYSDDFSYVEAGVPSVVNGFLLDVEKDDGDEAFPFYIKYYHTNFDTKDTYNEAVLKFNLEYYGAMGIHVDTTPALELDFRAQAERLKNAMNEDTAKANNADSVGYLKAVGLYSEAADAAWEKVESVNKQYADAMKSGDEEAAAAAWDEGAKLTDENLKIFAETQKQLLGLMYERPIVPHEAYQENIELIGETVKALNEGDIVKAVDEYAWQINNVEEWYSMYFSPEVVEQSYQMFVAEDNQDNQFWGTGRQYTWADVADAVRGITAKYEEKNPDVTSEIKIFKGAAKEQAKYYTNTVSDEAKQITALTEKLKGI